MKANSSSREDGTLARDAPWRSQRTSRRNDGHRFAELFQAWGSHEVLSVDDEDDVTAPSPRPSRWGQDPWPLRSKARGTDPPRYFDDRSNNQQRKNEQQQPAPSYIPLGGSGCGGGGSRSPKDYIPLESEVTDDLLSHKYCRINAVLMPMTPTPSLSSSVQLMGGGGSSTEGFVNRVSEKMRKALESEAHHPATPAEVDNRSDTSSASSMAISHEPPQVTIDHVQTDADESGELPEDEEEDAMITSSHHQGVVEFSVETSEISSTDPPVVPTHGEEEEEPQLQTIEESLQSDEGNDVIDARNAPPSPSPEQDDPPCFSSSSAAPSAPPAQHKLPPPPPSPAPSSSTSSRQQRRRPPSSKKDLTINGSAPAAPAPPPDDTVAPPPPPAASSETRPRTMAVRTKPRGATLGARKAKLEKARRSAAVARKMKEEPSSSQNATDNVTQTVTFEKTEVEKCGLLLRTNLECSCLRNKILEMALNYRELRRQEDGLRKDLAPLLRSAGSSVLGTNLISPQFDAAITALLKAVAEPLVKEEKKSKRRRVEP